MAPSGHSSSSHSSHSSGPSFHSSGSRSSFGNSHSSFGSGFSGGGRGPSFGGGRPSGGHGPSFGGGPSHHSGFSGGPAPHSAPRPSYFSRRSSEMRFPAPPPETYAYSNRIFYGRRHQYRYYPTPFIINNISYGAGYYDEDGTYYNNIEMEDAQGNKVQYLTCEYCGCQAEYRPENGVIPNCEHCGAPLKVENVHKDTAYSASSDSAGTASAGTQSVQEKKRRRTTLTVIVLFLLSLMGRCSCDIGHSGYEEDYGSMPYEETYTDEVIGLQQSDEGYVILSDVNGCDKLLTWDESADSYYDDTTMCWLWYNTYVEPAVWQYWYDGISSEYGDYGWMEYEDGTWYIETDADRWDEYTGSTDGLWYIAG